MMKELDSILDKKKCKFSEKVSGKVACSLNWIEEILENFRDLENSILEKNEKAC